MLHKQRILDAAESILIRLSYCSGQTTGGDPPLLASRGHVAPPLARCQSAWNMREERADRARRELGALEQVVARQPASPGALARFIGFV